MAQVIRRETTIERIYREVIGRKMPLAIKKVLLPKLGKASLHEK